MKMWIWNFLKAQKKKRWSKLSFWLNITKIKCLKIVDKHSIILCVFLRFHKIQKKNKKKTQKNNNHTPL